MRILNTWPPFTIYDRAVKQFGVDFSKGIIFTYGDVIYCKNNLSEALLIHERVHIRQQLIMGKDKWWDKYFEDPKFRYTQELEAYIQQYRYYVKMNRNTEVIFKALKMIGTDLSGEMYGNMITLSLAMEDVKKGARM